LSKKDIPDRYNLVRHLTCPIHGLSERKARSIAGWSVDEDDDDNEEEEEEQEDDTTLQPVQPQLPVTFPCPLGECKSARNGLKTRSGLKKHLTSKEHKCSEEEAVRLSGVKPRKVKSSVSGNKEQPV
jgi:hypothetical protein